MSIDRRMDKEDMVHVYNRILVIKKEQNNAIFSNRLDLEIVILSEVSQTKTTIT